MSESESKQSIAIKRLESDGWKFDHWTIPYEDSEFDCAVMFRLVTPRIREWCEVDEEGNVQPT